MSATPQLAYGNARVRARRARLVPPGVLVGLVTAERPALTIDGWYDVEPDGDASSVLGVAYKRLTDDCRMLIGACPAAAPVLRALMRLHELENVKLAWRAATYGLPLMRWQPLWRPLGPLETVGRDACASALSVQQLAAALVDTPFEAIAAIAWRTHGADLAAAEMTFDRWGSGALVTAADAVPRREREARALIRDVVCERDLLVFERAIGPLGVAPHRAIHMTAVLMDALGPAGARALTAWSVEGGSPLTLPRRLAPDRPSVRTVGALRRAIHTARRARCGRVFLGTPFSIAPPIAHVLLREDELRALVSLAELRARHASAADAVRVLDAGG